MHLKYLRVIECADYQFKNSSWLVDSSEKYASLVHAPHSKLEAGHIMLTSAINSTKHVVAPPLKMWQDGLTVSNETMTHARQRLIQLMSQYK